jgi:hypothetical protein
MTAIAPLHAQDYKSNNQGTEFTFHQYGVDSAFNGCDRTDRKHAHLFPLPVVAEFAAALCDHFAGSSPQVGGFRGDLAPCDRAGGVRNCFGSHEHQPISPSSELMSRIACLIAQLSV